MDEILNSDVELPVFMSQCGIWDEKIVKSYRELYSADQPCGELPSIEMESPYAFLEICGKRIKWVEQINQRLNPGKLFFVKTPLLKHVNPVKVKGSDSQPLKYEKCFNIQFSKIALYKRFFRDKKSSKGAEKIEQQQMLGNRDTETMCQTGIN
mgnify:CR=1 FL=1